MLLNGFVLFRDQITTAFLLLIYRKFPIVFSNPISTANFQFSSKLSSHRSLKLSFMRADATGTLRIETLCITMYAL